MVQVNKKHSVEYRNDYFILRTHSISETGKPVIKAKKTYPDIGSMVLQCSFKMDYEYTDAAMKSKAEYEKEWNRQHLNRMSKNK